MAINFPNSPSPNQLYTYNSKTWEWNGIYWEVYSALTSYITSAYTVGNGVSSISGVTGGNIILKSFSGVNITIIDGGDKLTFSSSTTSTSVSGDYLPLSGGTVTGNTIFQSGLTAHTISATTYYNLPPLYQLTGGTYSAGTIDFTNTTGGTSFSVTGLSKYFVTGSTPTGVSLNNGDRWFDTNSGVEVVWITDNDGSQWIQPTQGGGSASGNYLPLSGGTVTGGTIFQSGLSANTISATTYFNLPVSGLTSGTGIGITNNNNNFTISYTGSSGTFTGGTVSGATNFTGGLTANTISATSITSTTLSVASSAITFSNLSSTNNKRIITANNLGQITKFDNIIAINSNSDPQVYSAILQLPKEIRYGSYYDVYNLKARVNIPGGTNVYINYIGTITNNTSSTFIPTATSGLIDAADPTFKRVQSSLTTGGLVYDETLLFAAPVDLITVNYDNSTTANVYDIFLIAGNTNNFSCVVWVDYEFMVPGGNNITFTN
jgi:hypothetical protein